METQEEVQMANKHVKSCSVSPWSGKWNLNRFIYQIRKKQKIDNIRTGQRCGEKGNPMHVWEMCCFQTEPE